MAHCNIYAANHRVLLENRYVLKKKVLASCKALAIWVEFGWLCERRKRCDEAPKKWPSNSKVQS